MAQIVHIVTLQWKWNMELYMQIYTTWKKYSAPPFQPGGQEAICEEHKLPTQILNRKIRRYTPTRNESSWVLEEDRFFRHHSPILKSAGAQSRTSAKHAKSKWTELSIPLSALLSSHLGRILIRFHRGQNHKIGTSETWDIPYTALTEKFSIGKYRWNYMINRLQKSRMSAASKLCKVWIFL